MPVLTLTLSFFNADMGELGVDQVRVTLGCRAARNGGRKKGMR